MADESTEHGSHVIPTRGWKLRFDSPPEDGVLSRADEGDILALFKAWSGAIREERRQSPRYTPVETQAWVGWWKGTRFLVSQAELVNLSKGGALVQLTNRPPTSQPIWICLGTPHPVDYVQARVLEVDLKPSGDYFARVQFHASCPASFFQAAGRHVD